MRQRGSEGDDRKGSFVKMGWDGCLQKGRQIRDRESEREL